MSEVKKLIKTEIQRTEIQRSQEAARTEMKKAKNEEAETGKTRAREATGQANAQASNNEPAGPRKHESKSERTSQRPMNCKFTVSSASSSRASARAIPQS
jgi:hypothetical protein